jgi:nucleotidyltransferase substrate binding protein (TIGR01987 family)
MGIKSLENFKLTLGTLKKFVDIPAVTDRDRAGVIQAFEFTFEQSWKALQFVAQNRGVEVGSPKNAFTFAMQNKLIDSAHEKTWLEMLEDRNLTSHTYKKELADQVFERIRRNYISVFENLLIRISAEP